jgi:phosphoketolase
LLSGWCSTAQFRLKLLIRRTLRVVGGYVLTWPRHVNWKGRSTLKLAHYPIFTTDKPTVFAFHGYPWLIHRLTYRRHNHDNLHVRGYKEEGTTTTPFDMTVLNELDRFHLAMDVIDRVPKLQGAAAHQKQLLRNRLIESKLYISEHGDDLPEIRDWQWPG